MSCENLQRPAAYDVVMFQGRKLASKTNAEKLARELAKEHARRKKQQQLRWILLQMNLYYRRVGMNVEASHQSLVAVFVYLCKLCARSTMIEDERQPPLPAGRRRLRRETARAEADSYTPHSGRRRTRRGNGRCRGGIERIGMEEGGVRLAAAAEERQ